MTIDWSERTWPDPDAHAELAKLQAELAAGTWGPSAAVLKAALVVVYWSAAPVEQTYRRALQALGIPRRGGDARFARLLAFLAYTPDKYPGLPPEMRDFIRAVIALEEAPTEGDRWQEAHQLP
ncbi:hypothetical protein AB0I82_35930 [Streptomyces sp. NPDC050315]|uniref:hypothetical protein n=1 Tax=Streptomyces sp. NPDC050315 TaxID=3155039 RepID=UPI0034368F15